MPTSLNGVNTQLYFSVSETGVPGATAATAPVDNQKLGNSAGTQWTVNTTGSALAVNVKATGSFTVGAAATVTVDLTNFVDVIGTKSFAKVRGLYIKNTSAAEARLPISIKADATNGWAPFLSGTTPALIVPSNGEFLLTNPQIAAWVVSGTAKVLDLNNPGGSSVIVLLGVIGE